MSVHCEIIQCRSRFSLRTLHVICSAGLSTLCSGVSLFREDLLLTSLLTQLNGYWKLRCEDEHRQILGKRPAVSAVDVVTAYQPQSEVSLYKINTRLRSGGDYPPLVLSSRGLVTQLEPLTSDFQCTAVSWWHDVSRSSYIRPETAGGLQTERWIHLQGPRDTFYRWKLFVAPLVVKYQHQHRDFPDCLDVRNPNISELMSCFVGMATSQR